MSVTTANVVDYIGADAAARWSSDAGSTYPQIDDALATEVAAQLGRVTYPVDGSGDPVAAPDLDEALKRRVQRNLAMRALPLSIAMGDSDTPTRITAVDPEIRRLESPYRKRGFA